MNVLVAGGAGYVGCVLVRQLVDRGHTVRVYDRCLFGEEGLQYVENDIHLLVGDIREIQVEHLKDIDAVINLAGISSDPTAAFKPELTHDMNVTGAIHLARVSKAAGVARYLLASTCSVYESDATDDESDVLLDETSDVAPTSAYARSKLAAEEAILALADDDFFPVALRKGTVYGFSPRMRFDLVINTLLKDAILSACMTLHAGGETWRPVVEIRDAARAYLGVMEADPTAVSGETINIVSRNFRVCEMGLRIRETLRSLGLTSDVRAEYTQPKARSYRVSSGKAKRLLGGSFEVSLEDSIRDLVLAFGDGGREYFEDPIHYNTKWLEDLE